MAVIFELIFHGGYTCLLIKFVWNHDFNMLMLKFKAILLVVVNDSNGFKI